MWKKIAVFLFFNICIYASTITGKVVAVTDGDTVKVLDETKTLHKIRLNDIDAPEKKQAFGNKSKENLAKYISGKNVSVEYSKKDRYGRILGTIYLDKKDINLQQIKDGYAWVYRKYSKKSDYISQEKIAQNHKRGLWKNKDSLEPWEYRKNKK